MIMFKESALLNEIPGVPGVDAYGRNGDSKGYFPYKPKKATVDSYTRISIVGYDPKKKMVHYHIDAKHPLVVIPHKVPLDYFQKNFILRHAPNASKVIQHFLKTGEWNISVH